MLKRIIATAIAFGLSVVGVAGAHTKRSAELRNAQEVANVVFPSLNQFSDPIVRADDADLPAREEVLVVNKAYNRRWVPIHRRCDDFQKEGDGKMWGAQHPEYKPNSFYCPPNEQIYLDWKFLQTIGSAGHARSRFGR